MTTREAASAASSQGPTTTGDVPEPEKEEYVRQKYINQDSHLNLTRSEVEGMLEQVLESSPTVKYLLESLSLVSSRGFPWVGSKLNARSSEIIYNSHPNSLQKLDFMSCLSELALAALEEQFWSSCNICYSGLHAVLLPEHGAFQSCRKANCGSTSRSLGNKGHAKTCSYGMEHCKAL